MKANRYTPHIQSKLDEFAQAVEHLTEQVARNKAAITGARQRLSGGFSSDQEYTDLRVSLDQLVADQTVLERKLRDAQYVLGDCRAWLDDLPDDTTLELAPPTKPDADLTLDDVRQRIADAEDEIKQIRAMPTPAPDIKNRIENYVSELARPRVGGIAAGQQLRVDWPNKDPIAVLAFLLPEAMIDALMKEIDRQSNVMPLQERKQKIEQLESAIEVLQRRVLELGGDLCLLPPSIVLGVRATRVTKRAA